MKTLLHVGCGPAREEHVNVLQFAEYRHIRVDIDGRVNPDVIDDIRTLSEFENESVDGVFSSHNLEHLEEADVSLALRTFWRVLKPGGIVFLLVPDFRLACEWVGAGKGEETIYVSGAGPITPLDMIFGFRPWTLTNHWQKHRTGFTLSRLNRALSSAGFPLVHVKQGEMFDLVAIGEK